MLESRELSSEERIPDIGRVKGDDTIEGVLTVFTARSGVQFGGHGKG